MQPAILGRQQLTKAMRKARRQRAPTYCLPCSFQIIVTPVTSWLLPCHEDLGAAAALTAEPSIICLLPCSSFLPAQQSSSGNDHLPCHKIHLSSLVKGWGSVWCFNACSLPSPQICCSSPVPCSMCSCCCTAQAVS